jgi:hypothetical protein
MFTVGQAAQTWETMTMGSTTIRTMALVALFGSGATGAAAQEGTPKKSRAAVEPATLFMRSRWVLIAVENGTSDRMVWPYSWPAAGDDDHR